MRIVKLPDGIIGTPALPLAVEAWDELIQKGLVANYVQPIAWDSQAVVSYLDDADVPVGLITYAHQKCNKLFVITLGYVMPVWRRRGVYTELWERLVVEAQDAGVQVISSSIHVDNMPVRELSKKLGRAEVSVNIDFAVPPKEEKPKTKKKA